MATTPGSERFGRLLGFDPLDLELSAQVVGAGRIHACQVHLALPPAGSPE